MKKIDDKTMMNDQAVEGSFCVTDEGTDDSTQRDALLRWVEGVVKKHVPDIPSVEFWRVVSAMSADVFVDKYFSSGIGGETFWRVADTLEDDDFFPLIDSMLEEVQLPKSPVDPEVVYGNVRYERLRFVLMNYYYDLDAGAPFFARAHYDGAYSNEFPVDYRRALEMLLRYTAVTENSANEFEKLFSVCGEEDGAKLLANLIAEEAVGGFSYLAQNNTSEIEARIKAKAIDLLDEYGLSKVKEDFARGFLIDAHGRLFRYFGNDSNVIVPEGTTFIAMGAFHGNLCAITLPKTVVELGDFALDKFQNIYLSADIQTIGCGGLGAGPSLTGGGPIVTVYAPSDADTVAEYCKECDIIFVPQQGKR